MNLIYSLGIYLYGFGIRTASLFNPKAKLWVDGRKKVWKKINTFDSENLPVFWFHCASLGEFEQGRPIMEKLKDRSPCKIVVSFFSPSGYEIRKNYEGADLVFYLPLDTKKNAKKLYKILKPESVFFIKYEFWANYIFLLKAQKVKLYLISGLFRHNQIFFKKRGFFFRKVLKAFDVVFVQNEASKLLLQKIKIKSIMSGDTRFDRVMQNCENIKSFPEVESFLGNEKTFVIGSSWAEDEAILLPMLNKDSFTDKVIIAPHEIDEGHLKSIESGLIKSTIRYSDLLQGKFLDESILIIDNIGMLMHLYQYGTVAYIGGGFKTGLHNILEPAAFGIPVVFGPNHSKFPEAKLFIEHGVGYEITHVTNCFELYGSLKEKTSQIEISNFMKSNTGATSTILSLL